MNMRDMISETISEFFCENKINNIETDFGPAEMDELLDAIEACFEYASYSVATPSDNSEIERLKRELETERNKVVCPSCKGKGEEISRGPYHSAYSRCPKCKGTGKISP